MQKMIQVHYTMYTYYTQRYTKIIYNFHSVVKNAHFVCATWWRIRWCYFRRTFWRTEPRNQSTWLLLFYASLLFSFPVPRLPFVVEDICGRHWRQTSLTSWKRNQSICNHVFSGSPLYSALEFHGVVGWGWERSLEGGVGDRGPWKGVYWSEIYARIYIPRTDKFSLIFHENLYVFSWTLSPCTAELSIVFSGILPRKKAIRPPPQKIPLAADIPISRTMGAANLRLCSRACRVFRNIAIFSCSVRSLQASNTRARSLTLWNRAALLSWMATHSPTWNQQEGQSFISCRRSLVTSRHRLESANARDVTIWAIIDINPRVSGGNYGILTLDYC